MRARARLVVMLLAVPVLLAGCLEDAGAPADDGGGGVGDVTSPAGGNVEEGALGPLWSFEGTDGVVHSRDAYLGKPVVLFVMATWCSSCEAESPRVRAAAEELAGENVTFLSVSIDPTEANEDVDAWSARHGHGWPHGVDRERSAARALGVRAQSYVVVLDGEGKVVSREYSPPADVIVDAVRAAVA